MAVKTLTPDQMEAALREIGATRYHHLHPFHERLHSGACTKDQVRAWALNRYCYQRVIPLKDAAMLARMDDTETRRVWRQRIHDHDGEIDDHPEGGLRRWLALTDGLGLDRAYVTSMEGALPAVRFACEAYVNFVKERTVLEAIASSLTEMFSPMIIKIRVAGMLKHYDFISPDILRYFNNRLTEAPRDADFALDYVKRHATTPETQRAALKALEFKCAMLWSQLDALQHVYVNGAPAPGAWAPGVAIVSEAA
jgi:pyrroloquinoline-quinone synthase/pyrroloquinoline quinone biosynthesis protein D